MNKIKNIKIMHQPKGGLSIWLKLNENIDEDYFYELCKENGVLILPGYIFYQDNRIHSKFRLCYSNTTYEEVKIGLDIIKNILINL